MVTGGWREEEETLVVSLPDLLSPSSPWSLLPTLPSPPLPAPPSPFPSLLQTTTTTCGTSSLWRNSRRRQISSSGNRACTSRIHTAGESRLHHCPASYQNCAAQPPWLTMLPSLWQRGRGLICLQKWSQDADERARRQASRGRSGPIHGVSQHPSTSPLCVLLFSPLESGACFFVSFASMFTNMKACWVILFTQQISS